jgi:hypothetical protein
MEKNSKENKEKKEEFIIQNLNRAIDYHEIQTFYQPVMLSSLLSVGSIVSC